jgi:nitroreductase
VEFREVVRRRRMVRNYDPDRPVPPEIRERLLAHARRAPSAGNSQGWAFLVLEEPADRDRFWRATTPAGRDASFRRGRNDAGRDASFRRGRNDPATGLGAWLTNMRTAPLIIVAHSNKEVYLDRYAEADKGRADRGEERWSAPYWHVDAGFASLLILLTAVDEGLGACFFGVPPERLPDYRAEFGVPAAFTPVGAITVGYRAPDHRSRSLRLPAKDADEVVHRGHWSV